MTVTTVSAETSSPTWREVPGSPGRWEIRCTSYDALGALAEKWPSRRLRWHLLLATRPPTWSSSSASKAADNVSSTAIAVARPAQKERLVCDEGVLIYSRPFRLRCAI
jgi:hypothetical protein